ncbi:MAG: HYR domain-containing protein, partial [Woeseiaceae bacterium]
INPELINPELINPELINPELINPELINPELINPELINLGFANPELINPELINPELINPELINPELINPELINPELINSTVGDGITWVDYTYAVQNTGNVTTAFDADIAISGATLGNVDSQLIAWTMYITPTSVDCNYRPQVEKRVLATVNNPEEMLEVATIENPFDGDVSAIAAPGQRLFFTRRVFGTLADLEQIQVSGFTSASQAANCSQTDLPDEDPDNPGQPYTRDYFCQLSLADERERILLDTQPPTFSLPDNSIIPVPAVEADRPGGACVAIAGVFVTAEDNGEPVDVTCTDGTGQPICTTAESQAGESSIPFSLPGEDGAAISCTAIDDAGNVGQVNLLFDVRDTGDPFFVDFPSNPIEVVADDDGTASLDFAEGITVADLDDVDSVLTFDCVADTPEMQGPNDPLPVGTTTIDCMVSDRSGNSFTDSFDVIVADQTPPVFDLPLPTIAEVQADDINGAVVTYADPTATDTGGGTPTVSCDPASGSVFPIGETDVTCTADDGRGNTAEVTLVAVVSDGVPPDLSVPDDFVVPSEGIDGAIVDFEVTATDNIDPNPVVDCTPASGTLFPNGETTVNCTATDSEGNESTDSFTVIVGYAGGFGIDPKKLNVKGGSSNPLSWGWLGSDNEILDTSNDDQILEFFVCGSSMPMFTLAGDPGSSGFRIKSDNSWEYNWQSDGENGAPLDRGFYCIRVTSSFTGQFLESPPIRVR